MQGLYPSTPSTAAIWHGSCLCYGKGLVAQRNADGGWVQGFVCGIALDGAVLKLDDGANKKVYGKESKAADLSTRKVGGAAIAVVQPFLDALQKYAPKQ